MKYFPVVFILLILISLTSYVGKSQESKEIQKTLEMNKNGSVMIDTYKGSITIETWDKPEVNVVAKIEADGSGRDEEEKVRDTKIRIHGTSDRVEIETDYDQLKHHGFSLFGLFSDYNTGSLPFVHYRISMPSTARLKIKDYKSDTKISNLSSSLKMETYKGTVDIASINGAVDLETYKGDVKVEYSKYSSDCRFETYKGKIELTIPHDASFKLDADFGRRVDFDSDFDVNIKHKSRGDEYYRATVNGGGPVLEISSEKGDIRIQSK
jgi:DUF4097 and DUF4098 domain-containing protein YvlB